MVKCDLCGTEELTMYVDGATKAGPWAKMCIVCHEQQGVGVGTGRGQLYCYTHDGYIKISG